MDVSSVISMIGDINKGALLAKIISGISFNLVHGVATVTFLFLMAGPMERKLNRIKKKYGILEV